MYAGFIILIVSLLCVIDSLYTLIPVTLEIDLIIIRTFYEEKMLMIELLGYKEYIEKVHYRLIPKIGNYKLL